MTVTRFSVLALAVALVAILAVPALAAPGLPGERESAPVIAALAPSPTPMPPPAPVLLAPDDNALTTGHSAPPVGVPSFSWQAVPDAARYHIQISASAGFVPTLVDQDTYATSYTPLITMPDGPYYWRVKAAVSYSTWGAYSESRSFTKDWSDAGTIRPKLISPPDGATRAGFSDPDFTWTTVPGAATYRFEISTDDNFSDIRYSAVTLKNQHTPTLRLAKNLHYYWRVTPVDKRGNYGEPSLPSTFAFDWNVSPQPLAPDDDATMAFVPRFSWTAVAGAREYRLDISSSPTFDSVSSFSTRNTDYTPAEALSNDQDYYWRVQAIDAEGYAGPFTTPRHFSSRWDFQPRLLTPANNSIRLSYPFFSWQPVPGAERYQIQISESNAFGTPLADVQVYNATSYAHGNWRTVYVNQDYFWRVRALDAQGNSGPWSEVRSFRTTWANAANPVYPPYYYTPDSTNLPTHGDRTIAYPMFAWDTAHSYDEGSGLSGPPDYYELTVDDNPAFLSPNFKIETSGLGAAPTLAQAFTGLKKGQLYYWRVRAVKDGSELGYAAVWLTRYDPTVAQLPASSTLSPIYPADGFEAVLAPPVLGWLPVTGAGNYRVQISRNASFTEIVDEAQPQFVNYVPWQGRRERMPFGTYWWRVRAENPNGAWSTPRHFNLSTDVIAGNPTDFVPPDNILATPLTFITGTALSGNAPYGLGALHVMVDRTYTGNYNWVIAFTSDAASGDSLLYGLYFDTDHVANSGGSGDPLDKPITTDSLYRPEYVIYVSRTPGNTLDPAQALFLSWNGSSWDAPRSLASVGGDVSYNEGLSSVQVLVPYTALNSADPASSGSVALAVFSTGPDSDTGMLDSLPQQPGTLRRPAFVSDMVAPLFPYDTPLSDPIVYYDVPPMRWAEPYFDSVDGYQVELARDSKFTDIVTRWESFETQMSPYFALLSATFQPTDALEDNESYYWHVRIRHERYTTNPQFFDYGPWSPPLRFRLDSRRPGNLSLSTANPAERTPAFGWDRVEGAAGYTIQIDNDANFTSPLITQDTDATSYTPPEMYSNQALSNGAFYWRVAPRRSSQVIGHWSPAQSFTKAPVSPVTMTPAYDGQVSAQPTFRWSTVLTPTMQPRLAVPRYRLQLDDDANFGSPATYTTDATSYTLRKAESLADGTWYWRVAVYDGNNQTGPYSPAVRFYKQYRPPVLVSPAQGAGAGSLPTFTWQPLDGAAYYKIEVADNELFNAATTATTENTSYTPTKALSNGIYYWRVQMYDADNKAGPFERGRVNIGFGIWMPSILR